MRTFLALFLLACSFLLSAQTDTLMGLPLQPGDTGLIYKVVEQMPLFPGCDDDPEATYPEIKKCAETKMLEFIYGNLEYPAAAAANVTQGMAIISFIVERDGRVTSARILRNPGDGTGEEALRIVDLMAKSYDPWRGGRQNDAPVRVQFNLPVKFIDPPLPVRGLPLEAGDTGVVHEYVDEMPLYPYCDDQKSYAKMQRCAEENMAAFIDNIREDPPSRSRYRRTAVVRFIVERDGRITTAEVIENPGRGTGREALRIVDIIAREIAPWRPGYLNGEPVRVAYELSFDFN